jgi:CRISPR/Cas system-associated protein Csm6
MCVNEQNAQYVHGEYLGSLFKMTSYMELVVKKEAKGIVYNLNVFNGKLMARIIRRYGSTSGHSRKMVLRSCSMDYLIVVILIFYVKSHGDFIVR